MNLTGLIQLLLSVDSIAHHLCSSRMHLPFDTFFPSNFHIDLRLYFIHTNIISQLTETFLHKLWCYKFDWFNSAPVERNITLSILISHAFAVWCVLLLRFYFHIDLRLYFILTNLISKETESFLCKLCWYCNFDWFISAPVELLTTSK